MNISCFFFQRKTVSTTWQIISGWIINTYPKHLLKYSQYTSIIRCIVGKVIVQDLESMILKIGSFSNTNDRNIVMVIQYFQAQLTGRYIIIQEIVVHYLQPKIALMNEVSRKSITYYHANVFKAFIGKQKWDIIRHHPCNSHTTLCCQNIETVWKCYVVIYTIYHK